MSALMTLRLDYILSHMRYIYLDKLLSTEKILQGIFHNYEVTIALLPYILCFTRGIGIGVICIYTHDYVSNMFMLMIMFHT